MKNIKIVIDRDILNEYSAHYFSIHTKARKKPVQHPYHESINAWMIMKRAMMNALKQKWKDFIIWLVGRLGYADMKIDKCKITQTVYYPNNARHDIDNSVPKFILDGLVESGMIIDDDRKHITELVLRCDMDKDNPRTELQIKVL